MMARDFSREADERILEALAMRERHCTFPEIADELGGSQSGWRARFPRLQADYNASEGFE